jgi:hypothetical protein
MSLVANFLTGDTAELLQSKGSWAVASGSANLTVTQERYKYASVGSLLVEKTTSSAVEVETDSFTIPTATYVGWPVRATVWVWASADIDVIATVNISRATSSPSFTVTQSIYGQRWSLVSLGEGTASIVERSEVASVQFSLKFANQGSTATLSATQVFVTSPIVSMPNATVYNRFLNETYSLLPEYITQADITLEDQDLPLWRFLDIIFTEADDLYFLWSRLRYIAPEDQQEEKLSDLFNWETMDEAWFSWLAMILGIKFSSYATGFSSWTSLIAKLDTDGNDSGLAEWSEWETLPDTGDVGTDVSWAEIEAYAPDTVDIVEALRWQLKTAIYGIKAGTSDAFVEAAKFKLTGTKAVRIERNFGADPWHIRVFTLVAETPDVSTIGDESGTVLAFLASTVPAGYQVSHRAE